MSPPNKTLSNGTHRATAISIGAGNFINPYTSINTVKGIEDYMKKHNIDDINEIIGKVKMN